MALVNEARPDGSATAAFRVIYDRHSAPAFSLAYRMVGRRPAAEDVVQEAFVSLWRASERYDGARGSLRTWILGIVRNRAIDGLRRATVHDSRRASDEGIEERFAATDSTEGEVVQRDEAAGVRAALDGLPGDQLKVIELAYFGGFTHTEIAEMLDAPLGTVKGRMRLGLQQLRRTIGDNPAGEAWA